MQRPRPILALQALLIRSLEHVYKCIHPESADTGRRGEAAAYFHLRREGMIVVAQNLRQAHARGEIDLIAWDGGTLCFIEVKTRSGRSAFSPELAIDDTKQAVMQRMCRAYVRHLPWRFDQEPAVPVRFDVIAVTLRAKGRPEIRHVRDAFRLES